MCLYSDTSRLALSLSHNKSQHLQCPLKRQSWPSRHAGSWTVPLCGTFKVSDTHISLFRASTHLTAISVKLKCAEESHDLSRFIFSRNWIFEPGRLWPESIAVSRLGARFDPRAGEFDQRLCKSAVFCALSPTYHFVASSHLGLTPAERFIPDYELLRNTQRCPGPDQSCSSPEWSNGQPAT